ncbi:MAG: bifunctional glutamate N-acetyltransferase/amino-acid acetyltransferase ArgJ [Coriobacteriia bacterium]|nr:bifunctional glutamate N-acetyltransferase/amino-acid acetyltransferase ArgJ [Coriobacteriia bacterium]
MTNTKRAGICAPLGYTAAGIHSGISPHKDKKDLALVLSEVRAKTVALYTTNLVQGNHISVCKDHLKDGFSQALLINSANANACVKDGVSLAYETCLLASEVLGIAKEDVLPLSTGVIGHPLALEPFSSGLPRLALELSDKGNQDAANAILTTDTYIKEAQARVEIDGVDVHIGGMAKGSGMINPNMATTLCMLTTDALIDDEIMYELLKDAADKSINCVSVDGDTSTNDTLVLMANGLAGNPVIKKDSPGYEMFKEALEACLIELAKMLAKDGEGATKLLQCHVQGCESDKKAQKLAQSVINSSLVKAASFGEDANWGRILCALGYSNTYFDLEKLDIRYLSKFGELKVFIAGSNVAFDEEYASKVLSSDEVTIEVDLHEGRAEAWAYGCDLSYEYVRINGDYRS